MIGGKEKEVFAKIREHLNAVESTLMAFRKLFEVYIRGDVERAEELLKDVEREESRADELRRNIELMLYGGAFLPASRGDYVRLSELIDNVADAAESAAHSLMFAKPIVPKGLEDEIIRLVDESLKTFEYLKGATLALEDSVDDALMLAKKTETQEEDADK